MTIRFYLKETSDSSGRPIVREYYEFTTGESMEREGKLVPRYRVLGIVDADIIKENKVEYDKWKANLDEAQAHSEQDLEERKEELEERV